VQYAPQIHGVLLWDLYPQYQSSAPLKLGEWNHIKLVISAHRMNVYVNGSATPVLRIPNLEANPQRGGILLVGPGYFANLSIAPGNKSGLPDASEPDPTLNDPRYLRSWLVSSPVALKDGEAPEYSSLPASSSTWRPLPAEREALVDVSRIYGLPFPRSERSLVWLKATINSTKVQNIPVRIGWAREVYVFVNGQLLYADKNLFQPPGGRKKPDGRLSLENGSFILPLQAGKNQLAIALANNFYGWGTKFQFETIDGISVDP
jgi:hypothetical protein